LLPFSARGSLRFHRSNSSSSAVTAHEKDTIWFLEEGDAPAVAVYPAFPRPRRRQRLYIT
jgi:hypothetical protein